MRRVLVVLGAVAVQTVGAVVGLAVLFGVALVTASPWWFLAAGLVSYLILVWGLLRRVTRRRPGDDARRWRRLTAALTGVGVLAFAVTVLVPVRDVRLPPTQVQDVAWWDLPDGSRLAYTRIAASPPRRPAPVVFLHGGPGVPDMSGDSAYFGQLAEDGYDVYVYDQLGSGRSSRLHDPTGYTLDRWAADLEQVRRAIGADRMVLIGHSWGATTAVRYLTLHPQRVDRLVLSSPGPIPGSPDDSDAGLLGRLSGADRRRVLGLVLYPRILLSYALLQLNPEASHAFTGDREMDARFDAVYQATRPALHCPGEPPGPELHGLGFYAQYFPQSAAAPREPDIRSDLATADVPALIIKGRCDYLSWTSAIEYTTALPNTALVYLEHAGHNAYQDQPDAYLSALRAFLTGVPIPHQRTDPSTPAGYLGPP